MDAALMNPPAARSGMADTSAPMQQSSRALAQVATGPVLMSLKMRSAQKEVIEAEVRAGLASAAVASKSHATAHDFVRRTVRMFVDLHAIGFPGITTGGLRPTHVDALLALWRNGAQNPEGALVRQPLSRVSGANEWRALLQWSRVINKRSMMRDLEEVWPKSMAVPGGTAVSGVTVGRNQRRKGELLNGLTDDEYARLLEVWTKVPSKRTHYWLIRAVRELGMTRQQAFMLEPYAAAIRREGVLFVKDTKRRDGEEAIKVDTVEKKALVDSLIQFVDDSGRKRLGWPPRQVPTLMQAERKLKSALTYAVDRIRVDAAGAEA